MPNSSLTPEDLVIYKGKNGMSAGGYKINSILMQDDSNSDDDTNDSENKTKQKGGKKMNKKSLLNSFKNLAVPAGIFFTKPTVNKKQDNEITIHELFDDTLYNKLIELASDNHISKTKKYSKKNKYKIRVPSKKKTKKRKSKRR